jgi:site-specific DNA-methyltransferase (adenine-specific)
VKSVLARADAVDLAQHSPARAARLAYLDPPFGVGVAFGARDARTRGWRAQGRRAYDDRWPSIEAYLAWLEPRVTAVREALADDGTMWLHLDHRAVHEAKVVCDRVYGRGAFAGEIVWIPGNGAKSRRGPGVTHQTLLVYARSASANFVWNARDRALREPYAATSLAMHFTNVDEQGRRYRERVIGGRTYRYFADEGRALGSVWSDCPAMTANTPLRRETRGYPTQKPLKLLDRIVRACTRDGDLVVDPFCGSGTTLVAATKLGRAFVGCDTSELAIETAARRLREEGARFDVRTSDAGRARPASRLTGRGRGR